jgi:hypothetical protein
VSSHLFQLPACEDDLWQEVVRALLWQRDADEEQARNHLRLLEELALHHQFCGRPLTHNFAEDTATWLAEERKFGSPRDRAQAWLAGLKYWELLVQHGSGIDAVYEFAIPTLDEYFAARHLSARWAEDDARYRAWLPHADSWRDHHEEGLPCHNPGCGAILPPFRALISRMELQEVLLLMVGLVQDIERERMLLHHIPRLELRLEALSRCRYQHPDMAKDLASASLANWQSPNWKAAVVALSQPRLRANLDPTVDSWMRYLRSKEEEPPSRQAAAFLLGLVGDPRSVELLSATIRDDEDAWCRVCATEALGMIGGLQVVQPLIWMLGEEDDWFKEVAFNALVQLADVAVLPLISALQNKETRPIRSLAARALGQIGDLRAVKPLIAALTDEVWEVRLNAAHALGKTGDATVLESLIAALKDEKESVRREAALALGRVKNVWVLERLVAALHAEDELLRQGAADALGWMGDDRAVRPMIALLRDKNEDVRTAVNRALGQIGDVHAVEPLIAALEDGCWAVRFNAAYFLGKLAGSGAIAPLRKLLDDPREIVREYAQKALDEIEKRARANGEGFL